MTKGVKRPGRKTRYPGVTELGGGLYRIRVYWTDPKTERQLERERVVEAMSVTQALDRRRELECALAEESGSGGSSSRKTVGDVAKEWLETKVKAKRPEAKGGGSRLCPTTKFRYANSVEHHIVPYLGDHVAHAITKKDIERWRDHLAEHYAAASVNGHLRVLRSILKDAGNAVAADVSGLTEDDSRITDDEPNLLSDEELERFLVEARTAFPQHYPLILILVTTAMRMGTGLALLREDFDREVGVVYARRRRSGKEIIPGVKRSRTAKDILPLLPAVWTALQRYWASFSPEQDASGLAFPTREGGIRARSCLDKPFRRICEAASIRQRFTPHGCRRTSVDRYRRIAGSVISKAIAGHMTDEMHVRYSLTRISEKQAAGAAAFGEFALLKTGDRTGEGSGSN